MRTLDDQVVRRGRLRRRAEFLRVGSGRRWHGAAMTIQCEARPVDDASADPGPRFGFTLTKRVGNSVVRNRARRRLREAVRLTPVDLPARAGHDYVIVGRLEALRVPFAQLGAELARGLEAVHAQGRRPSRHNSSKNGRPSRSGHGRPANATPTDRLPARSAPDRIDPTP